MLRYRVVRHETGRYFVLPALAWAYTAEDTYATRTAAQETADWLNDLAQIPRRNKAGRPARHRLTRSA